MCQSQSRRCRRRRRRHHDPTHPLRKTHLGIERPPFECIALVLQGGGALGAYQAGVYQGLAEADLQPDWVAGISIGAINAAMIAGNPPEARVDKLRAFWERSRTPPLPDSFDDRRDIRLPASRAAALRNQVHCRAAPCCKARRGFFKPRLIAAVSVCPPGTLEATSFYDTALAAGDAGAAGRFRPHQRERDAAQRRRGQRAHRQFRLFRQRPRTRSGPSTSWQAARCRPAFRGRDRWRALLGRRARLQHAAAMGAGVRAAPRHARLPGRSVERPRRGAARPRRRAGAPEGDPVFQPDPRQHRSVQEDPERARRARERAREAAARAARRRGRQAPRSPLPIARSTRSCT